MSLSADERKQIIKKLKEHTNVAMYAFDEALRNKTLSEEELLFLEQNLKIISVLKPVITANRNGQKKTSEKNNKQYKEAAQSASDKVQELEKENLSLQQKIENLLKDWLALEKSEIYQLGKWLKDALSKTGTDRDKTLKEKELVHKDYYNNTIETIEVEMERRDEEDRQLEKEYQSQVKEFQERIDYLRKVSETARNFIIDKHGKDTWNNLIK